MLKRLNIKKAHVQQRTIVRSVTPLAVFQHQRGGDHIVRYSDGSEETPSCLRCPDSPCTRYEAEEIQLLSPASFPGDGDLSVCPTAALDWSLDALGGPTVDSKGCIGCGLCVARCPVGAISLSSDGIAKVLDIDTATLKCTPLADGIETRQAFVRSARSISMSIGAEENLARLMDGIAEAVRTRGPKFPTLFTRNLLNALRWRSAMRRLGDVNVRMDVLSAQDSRYCVSEVEFTDAVIDAPRSVLDSIAVLRSRYALPKTKVEGMVVAFMLPNLRSEYWQVVADIEIALGLRIHTVTAAALVMLLWDDVPLNSLPFARFGRTSIREEVEAMLGRTTEISVGYRSVLEAQK